MGNRAPFESDEWYHCYNRGVDKRRVFETVRDYERFLLLLYVANGDKTVHLSNLRTHKLRSVIGNAHIVRGTPLVDIGAYCLMPNHLHLVLKENKEGGIPLFMQRVFTGYTMYFNKKRNRTGALFAGAFKSKHLDDDMYLKHAISYIHLNPVELSEPEWKNGKGNLKNIEHFLEHYAYSSLESFSNAGSPSRSLLSDEIFKLYDEVPDVKDMLRDAQGYYQEISAPFQTNAAR